MLFFAEWSHGIRAKGPNEHLKQNLDLRLFTFGPLFWISQIDDLVKLGKGILAWPKKKKRQGNTSSIDDFFFWETVLMIVELVKLNKSCEHIFAVCTQSKLFFYCFINHGEWHMMNQSNPRLINIPVGCGVS